MFRWNDLEDVGAGKVIAEFKFHYVQMKQAFQAFWGPGLRGEKFKFHYVQMEHEEDGVQIHFFLIP